MFMPDETSILPCEIISKLRILLPSIDFLSTSFSRLLGIALGAFKCGFIFHTELHSDPPCLEALTLECLLNLWRAAQQRQDDHTPRRTLNP